MTRHRTAVAGLLACAALAVVLAIASADGRPVSDRAVLRQRLGLPAAVGLVSVTAAAAAVVRLLLTTGSGSTVGYSGKARREHPPVTERP